MFIRKQPSEPSATSRVWKTFQDATKWGVTKWGVSDASASAVLLQFSKQTTQRLLLRKVAICRLLLLLRVCVCVCVCVCVLRPVLLRPFCGMANLLRACFQEILAPQGWTVTSTHAKRVLWWTVLIGGLAPSCIFTSWCTVWSYIYMYLEVWCDITPDGKISCFRSTRQLCSAMAMALSKACPVDAIVKNHL